MAHETWAFKPVRRPGATTRRGEDEREHGQQLSASGVVSHDFGNTPAGPDASIDGGPVPLFRPPRT